MRLHSKLLLAGLATAMLLAAAVADATGRSLRVNEKNFELIWNEALGRPKTKLRLGAAGRTVECAVTLLGRFTETTISKDTALNQGTINHGELEGCTNGTVVIRTETMPWISRYRSFEGILPAIWSASIGLIGASFRIREFGGVECDADTEVHLPAVLIAGNTAYNSETGFASRGEPENITADPNQGIPLSGGFVCSFAGEGRVEGIGLIRNLPRTATLRITLI